MKIAYDVKNDQLVLYKFVDFDVIYINLLTNQGNETEAMVYKQNDPLMYNTLVKLLIVGELYE